MRQPSGGWLGRRVALRARKCRTACEGQGGASRLSTTTTNRWVNSSRRLLKVDCQTTKLPFVDIISDHDGRPSLGTVSVWFCNPSTV